MRPLAPLATLIASVSAALACVPNRARSDNAIGELWLPTGADTDVGARCYEGGFCDLPFTSPNMDPDALADHLGRRFRDVGWEQRCPAPEGLPVPDRPGWQSFRGGGLNLTFGPDAAIPGSSRYWHCTWHDVAVNVITYHLTTVPMQDGRQPILGYATYTPHRSE